MSIEEIKKHQENIYLTDVETLSDDIQFLLAENQRLVEALEFYAQSVIVINVKNCDNGIRANEALQAYKLLEKKD